MNPGVSSCKRTTSKVASFFSESSFQTKFNVENYKIDDDYHTMMLTKLIKLTMVTVTMIVMMMLMMMMMISKILSEKAIQDSVIFPRGILPLVAMAMTMMMMMMMKISMMMTMMMMISLFIHLAKQPTPLYRAHQQGGPVFSAKNKQE